MTAKNTTGYYKNGLPFEPLLSKTLDQAKDRVMRLNKSVFISVDGAIGSGKSTGGVHIADYLNGAYEIQNDGNFKLIEEKLINLDIKEHIQYSLGAPDFIKKLSLCHKSGVNVLVYDESGDFSKRGSLTKLNSDLNRIFEICRSLKIIIIFIMPNIFYIDRSVLDKEMIRFHIRINRENNNYSEYKLWNIDCINWIKYYSLKLPIPNQCYNSVKPSYRGNMLPLSEERTKQLAFLCNKYKVNTIDKLEVKDNTQKRGLSIQEIMKSYNVSQSLVNKFVVNHKITRKEWGKKFVYDERQIAKAVRDYGMTGTPPDNADNSKGRI